MNSTFFGQIFSATYSTLYRSTYTPSKGSKAPFYFLSFLPRSTFPVFPFLHCAISRRTKGGRNGSIPTPVFFSRSSYTAHWALPSNPCLFGGRKANVEFSPSPLHVLPFTISSWGRQINGFFSSVSFFLQQRSTLALFFHGRVTMTAAAPSEEGGFFFPLLHSSFHEGVSSNGNAQCRTAGPNRERLHTKKQAHTASPLLIIFWSQLEQPEELTLSGSNSKALNMYDRTQYKRGALPHFPHLQDGDSPPTPQERRVRYYALFLPPFPSEEAASS